MRKSAPCKVLPAMSSKAPRGTGITVGWTGGCEYPGSRYNKYAGRCKVCGWTYLEMLGHAVESVEKIK